MKLKQLAAIQFIKQIKNERKNEYFKAEDLIGDANKAEKVIKVLAELELLEQAYLNNDTYYKINDDTIIISPPPYSIDFELSKYKKFRLTSSESLLRQIKLLQSIKSSGEEDKLIELIDKWETVTRDVIKELFEQQMGGVGSLRKFVKRLGLKYEDLGFDEESDVSNVSDESESEQEKENDENFYYNNFYDSDKRIKYED